MWSYNQVRREDILHYGVPGMKWGVRKTSTLSNTNNSILVKNKRLAVKRDRAALKAERIRAKRDDPRRYKVKAARLDLKASKLAKTAAPDEKALVKKEVRIAKLNKRSEELNARWLKQNAKKIYGDKGYRALMKSKRFQKKISRGEVRVARNLQKIAAIRVSELKASG